MCLLVRNLSSAGEEARSQLRCCEGLVDSLLHVLRACVNTSDYDSKVERRHRFSLTSVRLKRLDNMFCLLRSWRTASAP